MLCFVQGTHLAGQGTRDRTGQAQRGESTCSIVRGVRPQQRPTWLPLGAEATPVCETEPCVPLTLTAGSEVGALDLSLSCVWVRCAGLPGCHPQPLGLCWACDGDREVCVAAWHSPTGHLKSPRPWREGGETLLLCDSSRPRQLPWFKSLRH